LIKLATGFHALSTSVLIATASKLLRFVKKLRSPVKLVAALPKVAEANKSPDSPLIQVVTSEKLGGRKLPKSPK
jgi:hypothetical protein